MKNYREIAENVFERRDNYLEMKKRRKSTIIKTVSSVFGIAMAGCLSITVYNSSTMQEIKPEQNNSSYNVNDYTKPTSEINMTTEIYATNALHTTVSKPVQTTSADLYTENTSTAIVTTANSVIPSPTTVHTTETTVYYVPEYTSAITQMTTSFVEQTYFTSAIKTHETHTTVNVNVTTFKTTYNETLIPVTKTTMTSSHTGIFTEETTQTTDELTGNATLTATSTTTTVVQTYVTSLRTEDTDIILTEIPETFVPTTIDDRKFSYIETSTTTVV